MKSSCWKKITRNYWIKYIGFQNYNSLLTDQMNNVERQCWANAQYSRRECLEVVGIPYSIKIQDLKGKVCSFFNRVGVSVNPDDIEACHRLYNDKKMVVKFSNVNSVNNFCEKRRNSKTLTLRVWYSGRHSYQWKFVLLLQNAMEQM